MGLLDGEIKKAIADGFRGKLLKGTLRRSVYGNPNDLGDPTVTTADYTFEGIRDTFSAFYAIGAGIPLTDVRILIIAGLVSVAPQKDDKIYIGGGWYQVRSILEIDPAGASYNLAAFKIETP